jgi:alcohol dehydrogenase (NADP+)
MTDSQQDYKFEGWGAFGKDSIKGKMEWFEYEPKKFDEGDIDSMSLPTGGC